MKLAIVITHPIRYYVPLFRLMASRGIVSIRVFYTFGEALLQVKSYRPEQWVKNGDGLSPFDGYEYEFVENTAKEKTTKSFWGINNPSLIAQIEQWAPDAVLVTGWNFRSHIRVMRYFKGKLPVYFRGDSTLQQSHDASPLKRLFRSLALRWVYRHVDKAFYVGDNNKAYYLHAGMRENQLVFAGHAIDNQRFATQPGTAAQALRLRAEPGLSDKDFVFLFAGKLQAQKDPILLFRAFVASGIQDAHLVFVGAGPLEKDLKQRAAIHGNIHFLPMQPQAMMPAVHRIGDVFILPSQSDTWGLAVNEAMACGNAVVVSSNTGCSPNLVQEGVNGHIIEPGNKEQLTRALLSLNNNRAKTHQMGQKSAEIIVPYNFENIALAIEQTLKQDLER